MEQEQKELEPINLTVGRVNTTRNSRDVHSSRSPLPGFDSSARACGLPWTPGTGKAIWSNSPMHLLSPGRGSLPFFQRSPHRVSVCAQSPVGYHDFSALEAMLNSPVYSAGAGDLLGSSHDLPYRFDTPSSTSDLLDSIFASTPVNRLEARPQPQLQSSESKTSQRGFVDLTLLQTLTGEQRQQHQQQHQQGFPRQVLDLKPDVQTVQPVPKTGGAEKVVEPQVKSEPASNLLHGAMFLSGNTLMGGLDGNPMNIYSQQQGGLPKLPTSGASQSMLPLSLHSSSVLPVRGLVKEGQGMMTGMDPTPFDLIHGASAAQDPVLSFPGSYVPATHQKSDSELLNLFAIAENSHGSVLPTSQPDADALASSQGINHPDNKTCHCKKSQCLKLYCDCFAAGLFCANCACTSCLNQPEYGSQVMERREHIMTRDPDAFTNKILAKGAKQGTHKKGCNCKRSYCLKKYCECFQGGVKCGDQCKCLECKNLEDNPGGPPATGGASKTKASKALVFPSDQPAALNPQRLQGPWDVVAELTLHASGTATNNNKRQRLSMNMGDQLPEATIAYGSLSGLCGALRTSPVERQASGPFSQHGAGRVSESSKFGDTGILPSHDLARLTREIKVAVAAHKAAGLAATLVDTANNPKPTIPVPASRPMPYSEVLRVGSATGIGAAFSKSQGQQPLNSSTDTMRRPPTDQHGRAPMDRQSATQPNNTSTADLFSQHYKSGKLKASLMSGDGSTLPESKRITTLGVTLASPTRSTAPGLLSMPFPALMPKLSAARMDPFQVSKQSRVEISPPHAQPVGSSATSLPFPSQIMEGCYLTVNAPTPRQATPGQFSSLSPSLQYGLNLEDSGRGLDSLFAMSPTTSDCFDPMQMLASPLYTDSPRGMMFSTTPPKGTASLPGLGPEGMSFSPKGESKLPMSSMFSRS
eukprot:gene27586-7221_t